MPEQTVLQIAGSNPDRVAEELRKAQAGEGAYAGKNYSNIQTVVAPIKQPIYDANGNIIDEKITRPISTTAPYPGGFPIPSTQTITPGSIAPTTGNLSGQAQSPQDIQLPNIQGLSSDYQQELQLTQPEKYAQDLTNRLSGLYQQSIGEASYRAQQEQNVGLSALQRTQNDLQTQLTAIKNEGAMIPYQAAGVNQTASMLGAQQAEQARQNAVRALGVSALLEASRGNIALAQDTIERAVRARFDPIKEQIAATQANLQLIINSPDYTVAEKNRALKQDAIQAANQRIIARQEDSIKTAQAMAAAAITNYPTDATAQFNAQQVLKLNYADPNYLQNVFNLVGKYQKDPLATQRAILEQEQSKATIALTWANVAKAKDLSSILSIKDAQTLGVPYGTTKEQAIAMGKVPGVNEEAGVLKQNALATAQDILQGLVQGKGTSAIGGNLLNRLGVVGDFLAPGGTRADFLVKLNNLKSLLSLDNVKYLKGQGQVSDAERRLLEQASAKLDRTQSEGEFTRQLQDIIKALSGKSDQYASFRSQLQPGEILVNRNGQATAITPDELLPTDIKL